MKLTKQEIKSRFRGKGQPRKYTFADLKINELQFIPCKPKEKDKKLMSIRSTIYQMRKISGMEFKATATETGVEVVRIA